MIRKLIVPALIIMACLGCKKKVDSPVVTPPVDSTGKANNEHISVLTQHNDNNRAGLNQQETALTTANVNTGQFGKLFSLAVDDQVYAQPLVVGNVSINSGTHNVVYVATVNNTIYAFDGTNGSLYWKKNFTPSGSRPPNSVDVASSWCTVYTDITYNFGIIGTPVIDSAAATLYFVARSTNGGAVFVQYLHAIDITTGAERAGSPVKIAASMPGTGDGSVGGVVSFDPLRNNQRQPLSLVKGTVYMSFASHCDWNPYHGWILGYDSKTLNQTIVYNDTPNGESGGLWESGMGMAADAQGNLYVVSGNGTVGQGGNYVTTGNGTQDIGPNPNPADLTNRGESAMKLTPVGGTLQVTSYFTPTNYLDLNANDLDYGVMGAFLIPNSNYFLTGCKDGNLYLLNAGNMGGYSSASNQVQQTVPLNDYLHCQPAYYNGGSAQYIYVWSENDQLRAFQYSNGTLATNPKVASQTGPVGYCGADLAVSSNGTTTGTGIVWACYAITGNAGNSTNPGILRAFDATDVTKELWDSNQNTGDQLGNFAKYCSPTIANGHVYLPTFSNQVVVYGLK